MKMGKSMMGALSYNENKVRNGKAELLAAKHFGRDISEIGFTQKLERFEKLNRLRRRTETNTLHLSLNFAIGEELSDQMLQQIADDYMNRIGFGDQPYLMYKHKDAAHPHIHIVTNTITAAGKPIYLFELGKRKSEPARKEIEREYGLIVAEGRGIKSQLLKPIDINIADEEVETKAKISNIVNEVIAKYTFTNLDEYNAILRHSNIYADRGEPGTTMFNNKGLVYSIIDKDGYRKGIPIKASAIYSSPTIAKLEKIFLKNAVFKPAKLKYIQQAVDNVLNKCKTTKHFLFLLKEKRIDCSAFSDGNGNIKEIYFIDPKKRSVCSSRDLGFQPDNILLRLANVSSTKEPRQDRKIEILPETSKNSTYNLSTTSLLSMLLANDYDPNDQQSEFLKKKRKKKRI